MPKEKVAGLVSTEIGLNTTKATESLDKLKASVKDNANEWKQMESQMKQSGDYVGASKVRYEGLTESVEKQEVVLERLRKEQAEVNRSTQAGEQVYQKYASNITKAERQLTSLVGQQHKAKQSYELQADGITELNQKIKQNDELTKLQTDRLDAEGNKTKAVTRAKEGLATKIRLMNELYEKQSSRLSRLESSENGETEAIRKQRLALEKTATAISQAKHNMEGLGHESQKVGSTFSETFKGNALAQGAMQAWYSVKGSIENAVEAGAEFNKEQDTMKTVWHALTTEAPKDGKELVSFINDISNHSIYTADSVNDMAQAFYHVHSNVKETKNWTQDFINLGSTMHLTDAQLSESGETFAKIVAGGKVGAEDLNMMINRFPMFGEAVQKASGKSMAELRQMSASGKLTSDVFVKAMDELGSKYKDGQAEAMTSFQGMTMYLGKRRAQLFGEIEQSSFNISKKMKANILDITSDKSMEAYAKAISKAMASVMGIVAKMIDYIRKHQKDIMQLISSVAKIVSIFGGAIWNTIKITFGAIGKSIGLIGGNANKAHDPLKTINTALTNILAHKHAIQALGAVLVSAFAVKKMSDFGRGVKSTLGVIGDLRRGVIALATSEKLASTAQWAMTGAQKALNLAMKANPIGLVIVAITALVAGFVLLYKHNKKFKAFVDGLAKSAGKFFKSIGKWFGSAGKSLSKAEKSVAKWIGSVSKAISKFFSNLGKWFKGVGKSIGDGASAIGKWFSGLVKGFQKGWNSFVKFATKLLKTFGKIVLISMALPVGIAVTLLKPLIGPMKKLISALAKWLKSVWSPVQKAWSKAWNAIAKVFSSVWNSITKVTSRAFKLLHDIVKSQLNAISSTWSKAWNGISKWFSGILNSIAKMWNSAMSAIGNTLNKAMSAISGAWSKAWNGIADFFSGVWNKMVRTFEPIIKSIHRIVSDTVGAIAGTWNKVWNGISDFFGGIWDKMVRTGDSGIKSVKGIFDGVLGAISSAFSNTWRGITDGFGAMWTDMMSWAKSGINGVIGIINNGIGAINSVIGMFGGSGHTLSRIPKFANGTSGAPAGLAIVNDAPGEHYQEAIIDNSGKATVLEGRNRVVEFSGGETVIPAHAMPHFAGGTDNWLSSAVGWISDKWTQLTSFLREPIVALTNVMNRAVGTIAGSPLVSTVAPMMTQGLIHGIASPIVSMLSGVKNRHDNDERQSLMKRLFGKGFAQGGVVSQHGFYEVAEQNMPEIIIPLDPAKKLRANDLLAQANQRINGNTQAKGDSSVVNEGDTYSITINVNADVTPNNLQKLQQAVEDAITRKQNARTRAFG